MGSGVPCEQPMAASVWQDGSWGRAQPLRAARGRAVHAGSRSGPPGGAFWLARPCQMPPAPVQRNALALWLGCVAWGQPQAVRYSAM